MKMDEDAQGIIIGNIKSIIQRGDNSIRDLETVKKAFNGFADNINEIKNLKTTNPLLYKSILLSLASSAKPFPNGSLTGIIKASNKASLNLVKNLSKYPKPFELHNAISQFSQAANAISNKFGKNFLAGGADEQAVINTISHRALLLTLSEKERANLLQVTNQPGASALADVYNNVTIDDEILDELKPGMNQEQKAAILKSAGEYKETLETIHDNLFLMSGKKCSCRSHRMQVIQVH